METFYLLKSYAHFYLSSYKNTQIFNKIDCHSCHSHHLVNPSHNISFFVKIHIVVIHEIAINSHKSILFSIAADKQIEIKKTKKVYIYLATQHRQWKFNLLNQFSSLEREREFLLKGDGKFYFFF